ncbi:MAG: hypothetical protein ACLTK8_04665 [Paeniclostridium sp.]
MLKLITKYRHETIIKEMEEKHQQELKQKEAKYKRYKENNDNEKYKLEKEIERLMEGLRLKDIALHALDLSVEKLDDALTEEENKNKELNRKNEKLEKEKKDLQSKVNLSIIAKHQLQSLCICKLDKKNFMYSLDLTPVHISVSGRKVYDIAKLLG